MACGPRACPLAQMDAAPEVVDGGGMGTIYYPNGEIFEGEVRLKAPGISRFLEACPVNSAARVG